MFKKAPLLTAIGIATALHIPTTHANVDSISANDSGNTKINMRYRLETVDQDNLDRTAVANTLKTRITWQSSSEGSLNAILEFDNVTSLLDDNYNSTANGELVYPVVADPEGTDLNQAALIYKKEGFTATVGRQRINLDDQRFVGGVAWRQNEQTYDGLRLQYNAGRFFTNYSYIENINRIFGPSGGKSDLRGNTHLLNIKAQINPDHSVAVYNYSLDFDGAATSSSNTTVIRYVGSIKNVNLVASYAKQGDAGDNPNDYSADYLSANLSGKVFTTANWAVGYEALGSDNGNIAFSTPLATLHKFQGFADVFLNTPDSGIKDAYLTAGNKFGKVKLALTYHQFDTDDGDEDLGNEIDIAATFPISKKIKGLIKYANYSAGDTGIDTQKAWFMLNLNF